MAQDSGAGASVPGAARLAPPHGLEQIVATFGDIYEYIGPTGSLDPRWRNDFLAVIALPFPLSLSWDRQQRVSRMTCHKLMANIFAEVMDRIQTLGLQSRITSFGGCFAFRTQRSGRKLSTHSWGIAIDLNPESNAQGSAADMDSALVEIFRDTGFEWGGDWRSRARDPMHFQYCTGY